MKPRISRGRYPYLSSEVIWLCRSRGGFQRALGVGLTPVEAYQDWHRHCRIKRAMSAQTAE